MKRIINSGFLILCILFVNLLSLSAQTLTVKGTVKDANTGEPLPGVNVVIEGTISGTITDINGKYSISVESPDAVLSYSFVGYNTQKINLTGSTEINVALIPEITSLDEIVVIGYQTMKRRDLTGSISSLSGDKLKDIPISSTAEALTGRMAGVQITTTEGSPDAEIKIRIRGGGSITQDNSPLYIVDGFPVNNFSDISPADIASIDVLKDASSTAIYGARGANGVVIITTKGGQEGKMKVEYNTFLGVKNLAKELEVLSPYEYTHWQYELAGPSGNTASNFQQYYGVYDDLELYKAQPGSNWQDEVFGREARTLFHNLSVYGGSSKLSYSLGLTHNDDEGIMIGSGYKRDNISFKLKSKLNDKISVDINTRLAKTNITGAGTSTAGTSTNSRLKHAIKYSPIAGLQDFLSDVDFESGIESASQLYNPVEVVNDDYRNTDRLAINFNGAVNIKLLKNLDFRSEMGVELGNQRINRFYGPSTSQSKNNSGGTPVVVINAQNSIRRHIANTLIFNKKGVFPGHDLNILLGEELNSYYYKNVNAESRFFPSGIDISSALAMMNLGTPQPTETFESPDDNMSSFFGRVNYNVNERYLASITMRADGSSKFAKGNRWGYFPSFAFAWRLTQESFMSNIDWLSNLKLRLSYGTAGNNRISDNLWKMVYSTEDENKPYFINEVPQNQLIPGSILSNPELKWETSYTRNLGLDFGFFKSRLSGTLDMYLNTTKDLLIQANIPANTGFPYQMQNIGETSNRGIELTLDAAIIEKGDFQMSASFNIAFNKNRVEKLGDIKSSLITSGWYGSSSGPSGDYLLEEGQPVGLMWGYVTDGMYSFDDFVYNPVDQSYALASGAPDNSSLIGARFYGPGTLKFKKIGDDDSNTINPDTDRTIIGNYNPKHTGGLNLTTLYKNLDLSIFFYWVYGNNIYNANKLEFTSYPDSRLYGNLLEIMNSNSRFSIVDRPTGQFVYEPSALQEMNANASIWHPMMSRVVLHSWAIEDGSFLRCNNLTLGYTLPKSLMSKIKLNKLRIYITGYNLFTITNYSGYDPEVDTRRSTPLTPGVDYSAYPRSRTIIGGINITF